MTSIPLSMLWDKVLKVYAETQTSETPTLHAIQQIRFEALAETYAELAGLDKLLVMRETERAFHDC